MISLLGLVIIVSAVSIAFARQAYPAVNITIAKTIPDYLVQYPNANVIEHTRMLDFRAWRITCFGDMDLGKNSIFGWSVNFIYSIDKFYVILSELGFIILLTSILLRMLQSK